MNYGFNMHLVRIRIAEVAHVVAQGRRDCYKINGRNTLTVYYMKIRVLEGILSFKIQGQCGHK